MQLHTGQLAFMGNAKASKTVNLCLMPACQTQRDSTCKVPESSPRDTWTWTLTVASGKVASTQGMAQDPPPQLSLIQVHCPVIQLQSSLPILGGTVLSFDKHIQWSPFIHGGHIPRPPWTPESVDSTEPCAFSYTHIHVIKVNL